MEKQLTVVANIFAKKGEEERIKRALLELVVQTRKEPGCINYDLHQSPQDARQFVMYENWKSAADLDAHDRSPHLTGFRNNMAQFLERPTQITKWHMLSELAKS